MDNATLGTTPAPSFRFDPVATYFGAGLVDHMGDEVETLGWKRVLLVSMPGRVELVECVRSDLGGKVAAIFSGAIVEVAEATEKRP